MVTKIDEGIADFIQAFMYKNGLAGGSVTGQELERVLGIIGPDHALDEESLASYLRHFESLRTAMGQVERGQSSGFCQAAAEKELPALKKAAKKIGLDQLPTFDYKNHMKGTRYLYTFELYALKVLGLGNDWHHIANRGRP